jgi:RNA polymerase sigma-70 factor (ECF subfamily)
MLPTLPSPSGAGVPMSHPNTPLPEAGFAPTQWSVVLAARPGGAERPEALERLCRAYWLPVYGYLRRRGYSIADAEDHTQGFFIDLLEGDFLSRPDPSKGRFRGYLLGTLRHYLAHHFRRESAIKRGGASPLVSWDEIDAEQEFKRFDRPDLEPDQAYDLSWAFTLLRHALRRLEEEQIAANRHRQFLVLQRFLSETAAPGDYDQAARTLGTTRSHVAVWIHRLNQRYAELVRSEVAASVRDPVEVAAELRHLRETLSR